MKLLLILFGLVLASCTTATQGSNLVNQYLEEANAGLPFTVFPIEVQRVEQRNNSLVTFVYIDANKVPVAEHSKAKLVGISASLKEMTKICHSPYYSDLRELGYDFIMNFYGIGFKESIRRELPVTPANCEDAEKLANT
ncbi:hypothetical protein NBZ79_00575 [Sneathiella marina]|uniref:Lipoprotein n=1 Tax=Sneathiella marina TaxID=2950108 RepID=A0ABY4W3R0_9PROT|nr:hypothetical protein [Sneathiella marina]USG61469.1 hypothetical protein NBZ79_00575 [Sneathiella marina]